MDQKLNKKSSDLIQKPLVAHYFHALLFQSHGNKCKGAANLK